MKILIACDSFKDALPAKDVCLAIEKGIRVANSKIECVLLPLADGGEGTADVLTYQANGEMVEVNTYDPLFRPITAHFGISNDGKTAYIDMAEASGLQRLKFEERNPWETSSYGTGIIIKEAINRKVEKIILGIGGSATNDGGIGAATALGCRFYNKEGAALKGRGKDLIDIDSIEEPKLELPEIEVLCDVNNPLFGKNGAAYTYAKQKGATEKMIQQLDDGLQNLASKVSDTKNNDYSLTPGSGAAGGMGFGLMAFTNAKLKSGIDVVLQHSSFEKNLNSADIIITGEGKIDKQTLKGKLINGICNKSKQYNIPVYAFCGKLDLNSSEIKSLGLEKAIAISDKIDAISIALQYTSESLTIFSYHLINKIRLCMINSW